MTKTGLFEASTSDDESDEWNRIQEKMKRRPQRPNDTNNKSHKRSSSSGSSSSDDDDEDETESVPHQSSAEAAIPAQKPLAHHDTLVVPETSSDSSRSSNSSSVNMIVAHHSTMKKSSTPMEDDDCVSTTTDSLPDKVRASGRDGHITAEWQHSLLSNTTTRAAWTTPNDQQRQQQPNESTFTAKKSAVITQHHGASSSKRTSLSSSVAQTDTPEQKGSSATNPYSRPKRRSRARPPPMIAQVESSSANGIVHSNLADSHYETGPPTHTSTRIRHVPSTQSSGNDCFPEFTDADWVAVDLSLSNSNNVRGVEDHRNNGVQHDDRATVARVADVATHPLLHEQSRGGGALVDSTRNHTSSCNVSTSTVFNSTPIVQSSSSNPNKPTQVKASKQPIAATLTLVSTAKELDHHNTCDNEFFPSSDDCGVKGIALENLDATQLTHVSNRDNNVDVFGFEIEITDSTRSASGLAVYDNVDNDPSAEPQDDVEIINIDEVFGFTEPSISMTQDNPLRASGPNIQISEIDPSTFTSRPWDITMEPIIHRFTTRNRPVATRKILPVSQVFETPVSKMWATKFDSFNQLQSEVANMLAYSDDNVVVSAPTGAGKTAVFEQAMARFFAVDLKSSSSSSNVRTPHISKARKIVYVSPSKALIEERFADWSNCLSRMDLGLEIAVVTGDGDPADSFHDIASAHFVLTTPEKWDSLTRRWTESFFLFASVKLFMVDEVHLLADGTRGCCLEATVCRMKSIQSIANQVRLSQADIARSGYPSTTPDAINSLLRFVAVSATLPNIADIAKFFEANEAHTFDESYRPVPLTTHVIGQGKIGDSSKDRYFFWQNLDRNVPELIFRYSNGRPAIVFCHSKLDCEKLADLLAVCKNIGRRDNTSSEMASQTRVSKLQRVLLHGIAYHHAGLEVEDRRLVERSFSSGKIRVICATSTIAMGVNLPAHLVVVKGTSAWRGAGEGGGYQDIDQATLLQMIGRAGRPGFDNSGTAVIMTDNDSKPRFENLASKGLDPVKSQMKGDRLVETINANISQRVIACTESAIVWLKGTLYFVQLMNDPGMHGIKVVSEFSFDTYLMGLCRHAIDKLKSINALVVADGQEIHPLEASHVMSHRLVEFKTMEHITTLPFDLNQRQLLRAIAAIEGLHRPVRRSEKRALNAAHKSLRLYKLDGPLSKARVQEPWEKAFVLIQTYVEELELDGNEYALRQEMNSIVDFATRMLSAIKDYNVNGSKHGNIAVQSLKLQRSIAVHLWSANDGVLRQIRGIGKSLAFSLHLGGISTFDDVLKSSQEHVEKAAGRPPPFGTDLRHACVSLLQSMLKISASISLDNAAKSTLSCSIVGKNEYQVVEGGISTVSYSLIAHTDQAGGCILFKDNITRPGLYTAQLPSTYGKITIHLIASIIGLDDKVDLPGNERSSSPSSPETHSQPFRTGSYAPYFSRSKSVNSKPSKRPKLVLERAQSVSRRVNGASGCSPQDEGIVTTVTPSPKPWLTIGSGLPMPGMGSACATTVIHPNPGSSYINMHSTKAFCSQANKATSADALHVQNSHFVQNVAAGPRKHPYVDPFQSSTPIGSRTTADGYSSRAASWKATKRQQQKAQERGFARKKDNPFLIYKHDPNDSESYLDRLTVRNKEVRYESIIPPEGFMALARAEQHRACSGAVLVAGSGRDSRRTQNRSIRRSPEGTFREVLAQRAEEHYRQSVLSQNTERLSYLNGDEETQDIGQTWSFHGNEMRCQAVLQSPDMSVQNVQQTSFAPFRGVFTGSYYPTGPMSTHPHGHEYWPHASVHHLPNFRDPLEPDLVAHGTYMQVGQLTGDDGPDGTSGTTFFNVH